jgi:hypothetical protein
MVGGLLCNLKGFKGKYGEEEGSEEAGVEEKAGKAQHSLQLPFLQPREQRGVPHGSERSYWGGFMQDMPREFQHLNKCIE